MTSIVDEKLSLKEDEILVVLADKRQLGQTLESLGVGRIEKKENGEPYLPDAAYHISFSHKDELAVAALSLRPVGVDIENVLIPRNVKRLSRLFHVSEEPESLYDFYRLWTSKEAVGKMQGTGITTELLKQKTTDVRHLEYGDYLIGVAGKGDITLKTF